MPVYTKKCYEKRDTEHLFRSDCSYVELFLQHIYYSEYKQSINKLIVKISNEFLTFYRNV